MGFYDTDENKKLKEQEQEQEQDDPSGPLSLVSAILVSFFACALVAMYVFGWCAGGGG